MGLKGVAGLLIAVCLFVVTGCDDGAVASIDSHPAVESTAVRIDPDDAGPIATWVLCAADGGHSFFLPTLADLIAKGPSDVRFLVVFSNDDTRADLTRRLNACRFEGFDRILWHRVADEVPYWTRDLFVVGGSSGRAPVLFLHHPDHYRHLQKAETGSGRTTLAMLRALPGCGKLETRVRIEGGAVVTGAQHVFISPTYSHLAVLAGDFPNRRAFLTHLEKLYGRPVVELDVPPGDVYQHPDRYLAPAGGGVMLLGDPGLAARLIGTAPRHELSRFGRRLELACRGGVPVPSLPRITSYHVRASVRDAERQRKAAIVTSRVESQLRHLGYRVRRMPWLHSRYEPSGVDFRFSYCNVVLESRGAERTVYLPVAGIATLDLAARSIWEAQGYRVVAIDALGPAIYGGGVRCLSQVMRCPTGEYQSPNSPAR